MKKTERVALDRVIVEEWLLRYQPTEIDSKTWRGGLGDFVRETIMMVDFIPSYQVLQRHTLLLARLARWCADQDMPFDVEVILDVTTVERWSNSGVINPRTAKADLTIIRRLAQTVTKTAPWPPRETDFPDTKVSVPYTPEEVTRLWNYAESQSNAARRRAARSLLSLGLGAGLAGRHVALVRACDIRDEGDAVLVAVGAPRARLVPILAEYEDAVRDLADGLEPDAFLGGAYSRVGHGGTHLARQLDFVGPGRSQLIETRRLRNTWLLYHLRIGTPLNALLVAAGLKESNFTPLVQFLPAPTPAEYKRLLRGA
jgi:hypothetical protein